MTETCTDCRSEEGVTVGLIDSLIAISRVLARRPLPDSSEAIREAFLDLFDDEDLRTVLNVANLNAMICTGRGRPMCECEKLKAAKKLAAKKSKPKPAKKGKKK